MSSLPEFDVFEQVIIKHENGWGLSLLQSKSAESKPRVMGFRTSGTVEVGLMHFVGETSDDFMDDNKWHLCRNMLVSKQIPEVQGHVNMADLLILLAKVISLAPIDENTYCR